MLQVAPSDHQLHASLAACLPGGRRMGANGHRPYAAQGTAKIVVHWMNAAAEAREQDSQAATEWLDHEHSSHLRPYAMQGTAKIVVHRVDAAAEAREQDSQAATERLDHEERMQAHQQVKPVTDTIGCRRQCCAEQRDRMLTVSRGVTYGDAAYHGHSVVEEPMQTQSAARPACLWITCLCWPKLAAVSLAWGSQTTSCNGAA